MDLNKKEKKLRHDVEKMEPEEVLKQLRIGKDILKKQINETEDYIKQLTERRKHLKKEFKLVRDIINEVEE